MFFYIISGIVGFLIIGIIVMLILILKKPEAFNKNLKNGEVISADSKDNYQNFINDTIGDVKDFLPFQTFEDYALDLSGHNYRAIIEVSSVNFSLMTQTEQDIVEASYQMFLNSVKFPIELYIQTREYDLNDTLNHLDENIAVSTKKFPQLQEYARNYYNNMTYITQYLNNSKIKKKYIIVSFSSYELSDVSALTNAEIKEFVLEELYNRCNIVTAGLSRVGLDTKILDKKNIAEVLYAYYHRNEYKVAEDIADGYFDTLVVNGTNPIHEDSLDLILSETQNRVNGLRCENITDEEYSLYTYIINLIENLKNSYISDNHV